MILIFFVVFLSLVTIIITHKQSKRISKILYLVNIVQFVCCIFFFIVIYLDMDDIIKFEEFVYLWCKISFAIFYRIMIFAILPLNLSFIVYYSWKASRP